VVRNVLTIRIPPAVGAVYNRPRFLLQRQVTGIAAWVSFRLATTP
jgi:hypothetical protein